MFCLEVVCEFFLIRDWLFILANDLREPEVSESENYFELCYSSGLLVLLRGSLGSQNISRLLLEFTSISRERIHFSV